MGLLEDRDLLPKAGPVKKISFWGLTLNGGSGGWKRVVYCCCERILTFQAFGR